MSLQARMSPDDQRLYNANRDLAHCFRKAVIEVANRLENKQWPPLARYLKASDISDDDLGEACGAFIRFIQGSCDDPDENMADVMVRVKWLDVPDEAQLAYMAALGTVISGMFFHSVREAHVKGFQSPLATLDDLQAAGKRSAELLSLPRWKRPLIRGTAAFRRIWNALRNRNTPNALGDATGESASGHDH